MLNGVFMKTSLASLKEHHFDPVRDSQAIFRELMMALAFPGKLRHLYPVNLAIARADVHFALQPLLTLLDLESTFHVKSVDPTLQQVLADYLAINTNSRLESGAEADFILCLDATMGGGFKALKTGTLTRPDDSTTVFYRVDEISSEPIGQGVPLTLTGPGVRTQRSVWLKGLSPEEPYLWRGIRRDYPMGVDIYFISHSGSLIGIPRSVELAIPGGHA
jgi:alpha-D-ribose 1-methylphosphonate 5-triphosphate synthase subunit PhnH